MRAKAQTGFLALILGLAFSGPWAEGGAAQEIRARVVDETSRSALAGAAVTLFNTDSAGVAQATTGPDGFFQVSAPAPGDYLIRVEFLGYATQTRPVTLPEGNTTIPAFVLRVEAVQLDTLQVEARRGGVTPQGVVGFSRPTYLLAGERMAELERIGISFPSVVRELGAGLRFRNVTVGERAWTCIETGRRLPRFVQPPRRARQYTDCEMVAIVINGVDTGLEDLDALEFVHSVNLQDYESVEYLTSVDAGTRYGLRASERGALVLWTRGSGPHKSEARGGGGSPALGP